MSLIETRAHQLFPVLAERRRSELGPGVDQEVASDSAMGSGARPVKVLRPFNDVRTYRIEFDVANCIQKIV
jgi:hypothetical protein